MIRASIISVLFAIVCVAIPSGLSTGQFRPSEDSAAQTQTLLDKGLYEEAEVLARARIEALRDVHGKDSLEVSDASDLLVRALLLNGKGAAASTLALAEQTLRTKEALLGLRHSDLVPSLLNLGEALLLHTADYGRATAVIQRAVTLRERNAGPNTVELAQALDLLGTVLTAAGRHDDALQALERSLRVKESIPEGTGVGLARTLEAIGWALQRKGNYERARAPIQRAVAIQEEADVAHPAYAETLNLWGLQLWFEGNLPEARDTARQAVAVAERTLRTDHPIVARSLKYLAGALMDLGDLVQGRTLLERALAIAERTFGPNHYQTWAYLNDLAITELYIGAYPAARVLFERALKIAEARFGLWDDRVATTVNNLALVDGRLGDYASARREHVRAIAIWERVLGRGHPFVARPLMNLAALHREQGSALEALPLLERALAIRERSLGLEHRDVASTLADLAATLMQLGRNDRAQSVAARAVRIWERADAPEAPEFAMVLALYADLQADRSDPAAARVYYERALAIQEKVLGRSHPDVAATQAGLALALANLGEGTSALETATSAEVIGREHLRGMLRYLPERQSLNYVAIRPRGLDLALSLVSSVSAASGIGLDGVIKARALVLDEMAARRGELRADDQDSIRLRAELASAWQRLANLLVRGPGQLEPGRYAALVEEARRESELVERTLAERSAAFRAELNREQLGLDQLRASLPAEAALVSFVRYERTVLDKSSLPKPPSGVPSRQPRRAVTSYLAFVLRPNQPPVAVPLGSASATDPLVSRWREDIAAEATNPTTPSGAVRRSSRESGNALRKLVWDPLTAHLNGATRIFIVPDGTLSLIPFVALPVGRTAYLLEQAPPIHYVSTERDLVLAAAESAETAGGLLAFGGPAFDGGPLRLTRSQKGPGAGSAANPTTFVRSAGSACEDFQAIRFQPLKGTLQEVQEVAGLWGNRPSTTGSTASRVLVGSAANESAFKQEAPGQRVLHLATHGFFLGDSCSPVPTGTRAVGGLVNTSGRQPVATRAENPLLLSGLALAGANRRHTAAPDEDDGILTAEEVASLNLEGVEWAVLSACDTGVGQVKTGEGVFGLRRAFQVAGARTVIMSLWSVDDQAARAWMRALYDGRFQKRLTTADAVHAASVAVLQERRAKGQSTNPFYWAAFVAVGNWW